MCSSLPSMHGPGNLRAYLNSYTMCSTRVVYLSLLCGILLGCVPCNSAESLSYHAVSCSHAARFLCASMAPPAHQKVVKHRYMFCAEIGRAFLGTLALDSNCIVWVACCTLSHPSMLADCGALLLFVASLLLVLQSLG